MANRYRFSSNNKRSQFGIVRLLLEIPIIALSIYLAFLVNEWGEEEKERQIERKYLTELLEEAKINQSELKADQDARNLQLVYLRKLLETTVRSVAPDTLREAIQQLLTVRIYSPTDAVYQDLVSSGNLRLITSDSIRQSIIRYRRRLARAPVTEAGDVKVIEDRIEPYLIRARVLSFIEPYPDLEEINTSPAQTARIIRTLLYDREFIDLVYLRISKIRDVIYFENPMQWNLDEMIRLLENEIDSMEAEG